MLNPLTRSLFPEADDAVLSYLNDDGTIVEPEYYVPIIPFALMNGISGIGTGFSCSIPAFSPNQIIDYLRFKLRGEDIKSVGEFIPYYEGFKGTVQLLNENKYLIRSAYTKIGEDKIRITELPVGTWTMSYITFLEGLVDGGTDKNGKKLPPVIRDFTSISTEVAIDITIVFPKNSISELESNIDPTTGINGIERLLKLSTTVSTTNMHMFNKDSKLHKYTSVEEIIEEFYDVRITMYGKRKAYMVDALKNKLVKLSNRAKYIMASLDGSVDLRKKNSQMVTELLIGKGFVTIDGDFKYLIKMPMDSVTEENVERILKEKGDAEIELATLNKTTLEQMWLRELDLLRTEYGVYKKKREHIQSGSVKTTEPKKRVIKKISK